MQLLGDGYEIPEMTKLHGPLPRSRFAQRSASSVDRRVGDRWPRSTPATSSRSHATQRSCATGAPGAGPPLLRFWDTGGALATQASVSSKSTHKSPLRQTPIGACRLARVGWRTCAACWLAHTGGLGGWRTWGDGPS